MLQEICSFLNFNSICAFVLSYGKQHTILRLAFSDANRIK